MKNFTPLFLIIFYLLTTNLNAQNTQVSYDWKNVKIGGGGYITGMKIHPQNNNIIYLRTDVGGAYRWNATIQEMEQIVNQREANYYGVAGIGLHPTNQNIIYLAVDRGNNASKSAILKSTDKGTTWEIITTPNDVKFGANGGRVGTNSDDRDREGSPIAVDPNNANVLWVGSRNKGLWKLDGTDWTRIAPTTIPDNSVENSIRNVLFYPQNPNYIFVSYFEHGVYRSSDGGTTFSLINGGTSDLEDVSDLSISANGTQLYAACRKKGIYRLNTPNSTNTSWINTNIPEASTTDYGYLMVTASPHANSTLIACPAHKSQNNFEKFYVSNDKGVNWEIKDNITVTSIYDWNDGNEQGNHPSQLTFDPTNNGKVFYTCFSGLWHTSDYQNQNGSVDWTNAMGRGHEEIVSSGLAAFPTNSQGNKIAVNSADHAGWIISDTENYPLVDIKDLTSPSSGIVKGAGSTVCEDFPSNLYVSSTTNWQNSNGYLLKSNDGGGSFVPVSGYNTAWGKANLAVASNGPSNVVVICNDGIKYSFDAGDTFNDAFGFTKTITNDVFFPHRPLVADAVLDNTFYIYERTTGEVFRSVNGGVNWSLQGTVPFTFSNESNNFRITAAPKHGGHLWVNHHNHGLYRSTDGGATWNEVTTVDKAQALSLGKERVTNGYPTIYILGELPGDTEEWIYRSHDEGLSWERISDENTLFLGARLKHMVADRAEYGKLYIGTGGLGIWSGEEESCASFTSDQNITVTSNPTNMETVSTSKSIFTQGTVNITSGFEVVFKSGESIELRPGFTAKQNSDFLAIIENCNPPNQALAENNTDDLSVPQNFTEETVNFLEEEKNENFGLRLFPNPVRDVLNIQLTNLQEDNGRVNLFVTDTWGKTVLELKQQEMNAGNYNLEVDISGLSSGLYYLNCQSQQHIQTKRFVLIK